MTGTTGSKGTGTTGTVPTGYIVAVSRGNSTVVASEEAINGSMNKLDLSITPVNNGNATPYHGVLVTMPDIPTGVPAAGN
jgi:hypothetical protein